MSLGPIEPPLEAFDLRRIGRRIAVFALVAAVALVAVATVPGVGEVRARLTSAETGWLAVAALCSLASMSGFAVALWAVFDRGPRLRAALELGLAEQGANVLLPAGGAGGPAFGTLVMRRAGVPAELAANRHVVLFLVTSAVSFAALVAAGSLASVGLLPADASLVATAVPAAAGLAIIALVAVFARVRPPATRPPGRLRARLWELRRFLYRGVGLSIQALRNGDPVFIAGVVAYYAFDVAALAAAFQAFGGGGPAVGAFVLAYTIGHAGAFLPTPGGLGGTDGGLIGMFVVYGAPLGLATAAVLGYRIFQLGLPVVLGAISLARLHRRIVRAASGR